MAYCIKLYVDVDDEQALWDAALASLYPNLSGSEIKKFLAQSDEASHALGRRDEPKVHNCLRQMFDPGLSPPGTSILDSECEGD